MFGLLLTCSGSTGDKIVFKYPPNSFDLVFNFSKISQNLEPNSNITNESPDDYLLSLFTNNFDNEFILQINKAYLLSKLINKKLNSNTTYRIIFGFWHTCPSKIKYKIDHYINFINNTNNLEVADITGSLLQLFANIYKDKFEIIINKYNIIFDSQQTLKMKPFHTLLFKENSNQISAINLDTFSQWGKICDIPLFQVQANFCYNHLLDCKLVSTGDKTFIINPRISLNKFIQKWLSDHSLLFNKSQTLKDLDENIINHLLYEDFIVPLSKIPIIINSDLTEIQKQYNKIDKRLNNLLKYMEGTYCLQEISYLTNVPIILLNRLLNYYKNILVFEIPDI